MILLIRENVISMKSNPRIRMVLVKRRIVIKKYGYPQQQSEDDEHSAKIRIDRNPLDVHDPEEECDFLEEYDPQKQCDPWERS
jgi:hypothetical protein